MTSGILPEEIGAAPGQPRECSVAAAGLPWESSGKMPEGIGAAPGLPRKLPANCRKISGILPEDIGAALPEIGLSPGPSPIFGKIPPACPCVGTYSKTTTSGREGRLGRGGRGFEI